MAPAVGPYRLRAARAGGTGLPAGRRARPPRSPAGPHRARCRHLPGTRRTRGRSAVPSAVSRQPFPSRTRSYYFSFASVAFVEVFTQSVTSLTEGGVLPEVAS